MNNPPNDTGFNLVSRLKENWKSGLTVSLVSVPLSVSLAVASQASPVAGIITAIWAGLMASIFGGSDYNVVGPTGALSGILATVAVSRGADVLPMLALMTGALVFLSYLLKLERYLVFIPAGSIHGFTMGVALIIALNQLDSIMGLTNAQKGENLVQNVALVMARAGETSLPSLITFTAFLAGLVALIWITPRIPGAIILAPLGIILGYLSDNDRLPFKLQTLGMKYQDIEPALWRWPRFRLDPTLAVPAVTVSIVAILETMLSAKIADGMTGTKHEKRKEMLGLAAANIASGLMGGLPATAALARTSLNVKSGANGKFSATLNSVFVAAIALLLIVQFRHIPMAVIAAILVFTAGRMIEREHFVRMYKLDRMSFYISIVVALVTLGEDPIFGILIGTTVSLIIFIERLSKGQFELMAHDETHNVARVISDEEIESIAHADVLVYSIKGTLVYLNAQAHLRRFEQHLKEFKSIIIRLRGLHFIDLDGVDAFEELVELIQAQGKQVLVSSVNPLIEKMLEDSPSFVEIREKGLLFPKTREALKHLGCVEDERG